MCSDYILGWKGATKQTKMSINQTSSLGLKDEVVREQGQLGNMAVGTEWHAEFGVMWLDNHNNNINNRQHTQTQTGSEITLLHVQAGARQTSALKLRKM